MDNINAFITELIALLGNIETLIGVIVGASVSAIVAYRKIRDMLLMKELTKIISPISASAETSAMSLLESLRNRPSPFDTGGLPVNENIVNSNRGKELIVATASFEQAKEKKPGLLKKLGIKSPLDLLPIVTTVYQGVVKPIIKANK